MIAALSLVYLGFLLLAFKLRLLRPTLWWKLSPLVIALGLEVALFIPMQFWAPAGSVVVAQYSVQIVPNVAGPVIEIPVVPNAPLKKGDVLFRIDPTTYRATVDDLEAQLDLTETRLAQTQRLAERGAGSVFDVESLTAQVEQLKARLANARFNLEQTTVRAPAQGYVTNVALRVGARVGSTPGAGVMAFIESGKPIVGILVLQSNLRFIQPGQPAEIAFKMYPGGVFDATVVYVLPASVTGMRELTGFAVSPSQVPHAPMWVRLELGEEAEALNLPVGATGTGAIYTEKGLPTQIIRRVMVRMEAILNYILPF